MLAETPVARLATVLSAKPVGSVAKRTRGSNDSMARGGDDMDLLLIVRRR